MDQLHSSAAIAGNARPAPDWREMLFGTDPVPWLLDSGEPYARWVTLALVQPGSDPDRIDTARRDVLDDDGVRDLVAGLPSWGDKEFSGHHSPKFMPNRLNLLADMGVRGGDFDEIEGLLDRMLEHQDPSGRFQSFGRLPRRPKPEWGSLLCDTNVITDVLMRFDRGGDERVAKALRRMERDLAATPQGRAWQCVPERRSLFRGPGRKADVCPQVTLEGLRAFSHVPESDRPDWVTEVARTPLEIWRRRTDERPYQFGHGYQFKSVKWPNYWYDVLWVLETLGRFPALWRGADARAEDRRALAELAACLVAYNFDDQGRVVPRRTYRGFESYSFGQKKTPSPFATARALAALARLADLAEEIAAVDVTALPSSKGGSGTPVPPRGRREPVACPVPLTSPTFPEARGTARVLARQHLAAGWDPASVESIVADVAGLDATSPTGPYLALRARLPGFAPAQLDAALYERRSLVRYRCMRGTVFVLRREMLPVVHAATNEAVLRYARRFAEFRGVSAESYERAAADILDLLRAGPLSTAQIRERLRPNLDVAAVVNVMAAEGLVLRDRPLDGWRDRHWTYVPLEDALPEVRLDALGREDADVALLRAYVRAFGPATAADAAWWTGIGKQRVRRALRALEDEVVEIELADVPGEAEPVACLMHSADVDELSAAAAGPSPAVAFLPSLDPYTMGYAGKGRYVPDRARPCVFDRSGNITSVVLVDGRLAGVWDLAPDTAAVVLVHLFEPADPPVRSAIEASAREVGMFWYGEEASVEWRTSMVPLADRTPGCVVKPLR